MDFLASWLQDTPIERSLIQGKAIIITTDILEKLIERMYGDQILQIKKKSFWELLHTHARKDI